MWTKLKEVFSSKKPVVPKQQYDPIAVLMLKQIIHLHQQGSVILSKCQTLTEQKDRILERACELGLNNTDIETVSNHITKLENNI